MCFYNQNNLLLAPSYSSVAGYFYLSLVDLSLGHTNCTGGLAKQTRNCHPLPGIRGGNSTSFSLKEDLSLDVC